MRNVFPLFILACICLLPGFAAGVPDDNFIPGEVVVRFSGMSLESMTMTAERVVSGAVAIQDLSDAGLPGVRVLRLPDGLSPLEAASALSDDPSVLYAEPNYVYRIDTRPNDYLFSRQWGLLNTGQSGGKRHADINVSSVWERVTVSTGPVIAVIDTGVDYDHPDLADNIWTNPGETGLDGQGRDRRTNRVDDDRNGYTDDWRGWDFRGNDNDPMDGYGHGTHCAGIAAASGDNRIGISGVNWKAEIMPLKFIGSDGSGTEADAARAILYARMMGADVMSCSWGGPAESQLLKDAIGASPVPVVCSAGNDGVDIDVFPHYPASYDSAPVIAVAATDRWDRLASWSSYGPVSVDVAAPGNSIYSTLPGNTYGYMSGTSMAVPFVTGLAGLISAKNPHLRAGKIKPLILENVRMRSTLTGKILTGGRIDAFRSFRKIPELPG